MSPPASFLKHVRAPGSPARTASTLRREPRRASLTVAGARPGRELSSFQNAFSDRPAAVFFLSKTHYLAVPPPSCAPPSFTGLPSSTLPHQTRLRPARTPAFSRTGGRGAIRQFFTADINGYPGQIYKKQAKLYPLKAVKKACREQAGNMGKCAAGKRRGSQLPSHRGLKCDGYSCFLL